MRKKLYESAAQLQFDFSSPTPVVHLTAIPQYPDWENVTDITRRAGFSPNCQVSREVYEQLDDQALYDVLWTAGFTLSVNEDVVTKFTLELAGKDIQFKAIQTNGAVRVGYADDF